MTRSPGGKGLAARLGGGGSTAIAIGVMNVCTYAYTMIAANALGPKPYGAFYALMNLLLIVGVVSLSLQATAARRISADPDHVGQIERGIVRVAYRSAFALGGLLLLASPLINRVLGLDSLLTASLVGLSAIPLTIMGAQAGILQGERRWKALGLLYIAAGIPRVLVGSALIAWQPTEVFAIIGAMVGFCAPVVVGWWALRETRAEGAVSQHHDSAAIVKETVQNSGGLFAFYALSNIDIIVARNVMDAHDAGLYAAGLIVAKAVLFLPQFVVVVAFPAMSTVSERRRALIRSLTLVAGIGVVSVAGAWLLSDIAILFAGGRQFAEMQSHLWLFAIVGTLMSMIQLLVYSVLARQNTRVIYLVWAALAALVVGGLLTSSVTGLLTVVLVVDTLVLVALLAASMVVLRQPSLEPEPAAHPVS